MRILRPSDLATPTWSDRIERLWMKVTCSDAWTLLQGSEITQCIIDFFFLVGGKEQLANLSLLKLCLYIL